MLFGAHGIVLGPLIVGLSLALLEIWRHRTVEDAPQQLPLA